MRNVELDEAKKNWHEVLESALQGEEVLITQKQRPVLSVSRIAEEDEPCREPGSAKGLIRMREDFDEPLPDFEEYKS
jgi:antitoxin (DNA-binding transcriptional repressor) of toxin-antitoxin stability system